MKVGDLTESLVDKEILVRGRVQGSRGTGKLVFVVLRQQSSTVQAVASVDEKTISKGMVKFITKCVYSMRCCSLFDSDVQLACLASRSSTLLPWSAASTPRLPAARSRILS